MIDEGLYALLAADDGVLAIVNARIFQVAVPEDLDQYPCVGYSFVGGASDPTFTTSGVIRQRVELNAYSVNPSEAANLRAAIIKAVNGWQQTLSDGTNVLNTYLLNPGTDFVGEDKIFRRMCEFYVLYTLPTS
jgi:Protein of unknown function (DUF3168)